jgi:hypothetical protein
MKVLRGLLRAVLTATALVPWLWLILFAALAAAATLHLGRLPRYNNPDPKHIVELALLHGMAQGLLVPMALSPLAVGACLAIRSFVSPDIREERWKLLAYALGYALAAAVVFGNPLRLSDWFLD